MSRLLLAIPVSIGFIIAAGLIYCINKYCCVYPAEYPNAEYDGYTNNQYDLSVETGVPVQEYEHPVPAAMAAEFQHGHQNCQVIAHTPGVVYDHIHTYSQQDLMMQTLAPPSYEEAIKSDPPSATVYHSSCDPPTDTNNTTVE